MRLQGASLVDAMLVDEVEILIHGIFRQAIQGVNQADPACTFWLGTIVHHDDIYPSGMSGYTRRDVGRYISDLVAWLKLNYPTSHPTVWRSRRVLEVH